MSILKKSVLVQSNHVHASTNTHPYRQTHTRMHAHKRTSSVYRGIKSSPKRNISLASPLTSNTTINLRVIFIKVHLYIYFFCLLVFFLDLLHWHWCHVCCAPFVCCCFHHNCHYLDALGNLRGTALNESYSSELQKTGLNYSIFYDNYG